MTRSKILKMKLYMFLAIFLLAECAVTDWTFRERRDTLSKEEKHSQQRNTVLPDGTTYNQESITLKSSIEARNKTAHATVAPKQHTNEAGHMPSLNPGALLRGFFVFIGLSILVLAYIVFRSFRLNKARTQMVRKYGVLTHRQDVEMRPLPLEEEDDEDTTVFDACNVLTNSAQHQNL